MINFEQVKGLQLVGRGAFTRCYKESESTVLLVSCDPLKECAALFAQSYDKLIPKSARLDYDCDSHGIAWQLYRMQNYGKTQRNILSKLDLHNARLYRELYAIFKKSIKGHYDLFNAFESLPECFSDEKEILQDYIGDLCNSCDTDNLRFEISPRNVRAVSGQLILLDCFFDIKTLQQVNSTKTRKRWA